MQTKLQSTSSTLTLTYGSFLRDKLVKYKPREWMYSVLQQCGLPLMLRCYWCTDIVSVHISAVTTFQNSVVSSHGGCTSQHAGCPCKVLNTSAATTFENVTRQQASRLSVRSLPSHQDLHHP